MESSGSVVVERRVDLVENARLELGLERRHEAQEHAEDSQSEERTPAVT
jgi:hypothetical protein